MNLTGKPISASYQYLMTIDNTSVSNGTGSAVPYINVTASYATTASCLQVYDAGYGRIVTVTSNNGILTVS